MGGSVWFSDSGQLNTHLHTCCRPLALDARSHGLPHFAPPQQSSDFVQRANLGSIPFKIGDSWDDLVGHLHVELDSF